MGIRYLLFCLFKLCVYEHELGLLNELLIIIIAQRGAKLWPVKVGSTK